MKFDWALVILPYGDVWRRKRKLMYSHMHQAASTRYYPVQVTSARRFAQDILATDMSPKALPRAVSLYLGRTIIKAVYGIDIEDEQSEFIRLPEMLVQSFTRVTIPGQFMVDLLPFCEHFHGLSLRGHSDEVVVKHVPAWFPGAGFQHLAQEHLVMQRQALNNPVEHIQAEMVRLSYSLPQRCSDYLLQIKGTAPPSMARRMLEEDPQQSRLEDIKDVAGLAYIAGNDTTGAAVLAFFLAMVLYPDVQAKAQAEIDRVVGKDRLPEFSDEKYMPYVQALVSECLRWLPMAPMGETNFPLTFS
jgi:cytochrome P450